MKFLRKIDIGKINIDTIRGVSSKKPILIDGKSASTSSGNHQKVIKKINKNPDVKFVHSKYHGRLILYPCDFEITVYVVHNIATKKLYVYMRPEALCELYRTLPREIPMNIERI